MGPIFVDSLEKIKSLTIFSYIHHVNRLTIFSVLAGALSWRVVAEDCSGVHTTIRSHSREVDAIMGISPDSLVLIQDNLNHDTLFLTSTKSVIGWTALPNSIRIYFHQVESYFHYHIVLIDYYVKFIYSEKATTFCEISHLLLTLGTVVKS